MDSSRGTLRSTVAGTAGHAGQAAVTWRSGIFAGPSNAGRTTWTLSLADRRSLASPSTSAAAIYTVRILDQASGTGRTIVDRATVPLSGGPLVASPAVTLPAGSIAAGATYRLEISIRIPFGASAGDGAVDIAGPQLAVEPAASVPSPTPVPALPDPSVLTPPPPTPAPGGSTEETRSGEDAPTSGDDPARDALQTCLDGDRDLAIVGASSVGRKLAIEGRADAERGTAVELMSVDGWHLGRTLVGANGLFSVALPEPRGSAGTRRVLARLADGTRSDATMVERRNVITNDRWTGTRVELRGTLTAALARRGRLGAVLNLSGVDPCALTRHVRATRFVIDRRTGVYRAVFSVQKIAMPTGQKTIAPALAQLSVRRSAAGSGPRAVVSQVIFGPSSDRRGT